MTTKLKNLLKLQLRDIEAGWSIGSFGAIGEFHQRVDDDLQIDAEDQYMRATEKGAIRFDSAYFEQMNVVAYETLSPRTHRWGQGVVFCLPSEQAEMNKRGVLTELGPDKEAIRTDDKEAILFDMGLEQPQIDFCIRTEDPDLIALLRTSVGKSLQDHDNPTMAAILSKHPHRVVLSKLGRVEVYQKIGGPDTGGVSPDGPHTHVLPKLLNTGRTHSANVPVPEGYLPCASLHPASPVMASSGDDIAFDPVRYDAFQEILLTYGREEFVENKLRLLKAFNELSSASDFELPDTRMGRAAVRIALRQIRRAGRWEENAKELEWLDIWQKKFDRITEYGEFEDNRIGH